MPTYEYRCLKGHEFEMFQRMSDPPVTECPECGKAAERVLSGGGGLLFKGDGFYITDYRSDSYKKAAAKDKPSTSESKDSGGKSEGKSGGKAETKGGSSSGSSSSGSSSSGSSGSSGPSKGEE